MEEGRKLLTILAENKNKKPEELDFYDYFDEVPSEEYINVSEDEEHRKRFFDLKDKIFAFMRGDRAYRETHIAELTPNQRDSLWREIIRHNRGE
jgi:hypothetical protein